MNWLRKMEEADAEKAKQTLESTEMFMVGIIDAALAAQNAAIAAESMGLGICYIGGIRNELAQVAELLKTPKRVIPLFGMSIGYPSNQSDPKPRLPLNNVYHEDEYIQDDEQLIETLQQYNEVISAYYDNRTSGKRKDRWTEAMENFLQNPKRLYMKQFLEDAGLPLELNK